MNLSNESVEVSLTTLGLTAHGADLRVLSLREPRAEDLMSAGFPFSILVTDNGDKQAVINGVAIARLASRCGNVPLSTIKQLNAADFMAVQEVVMSFVGKPETSLEAVPSAKTVVGD